MPTKAEIDQEYRDRHADLEARYYKTGELEKAEFDQLHGQLWNNHQAELIAGGHRKPAQPARDLGAEMDNLKGRVTNLEAGRP